MPGMNLRSIRVELNLFRSALRINQSFDSLPVPALRPYATNVWRPGHGSPEPIPANSPDSTNYLPSPMTYWGP